MPNQWICRLCEATGLGGIREYSLHYEDNHFELETERRRYGAKP